MKPRLVLADDHMLVLDAIERLLEADFDVIAKVDDGHKLLEVAARERPDAVVVDILMPRLSGIEAARRLRRGQPEVRIVFLTMADDPEIAAEAVRLGGCGYVLKRCAASELISALHGVLRRHPYMTPLIADETLGALAAGAARRASREALTVRQCEVLRLLGEGRSMRDVAQILKVAPATVAGHKYRIMQQLQIKTNAELVLFTVKHHP